MTPHQQIELEAAREVIKAFCKEGQFGPYGEIADALDVLEELTGESVDGEKTIKEWRADCREQIRRNCEAKKTSRCSKCSTPMHPADAAQSPMCAVCRKKGKTPLDPARDLNRRGTEATGRPALSTLALGGTTEMESDKDPWYDVERNS